jgi:hypothetical protein
MFEVLGPAPVWKKRLKSAEEFPRQAQEHRLPVCAGSGELLYPDFALKIGAQSIIGVPPVSEFQAG